jgi:hypothetical protein
MQIYTPDLETIQGRLLADDRHKATELKMLLRHDVSRERRFCSDSDNKRT